MRRTDRQRLDSRDREEGCLPPSVAKPDKAKLSTFSLREEKAKNSQHRLRRLH